MLRNARSARSVSRKTKKVLGIDASLTSTGYSYRDGDTVMTGTIKPKKIVGPERLHFIREQAREVIEYAQPDLIVLEDYAMAGKGRTFSIGEGGGVLRLLFWEAGIDVMLVPPSTLKEAIAGRGTLSKGPEGKKEMRAAISSLLHYDISQDDEADAFGLMSLGEAMANSSGHPVIKARLLLAKRPPTTVYGRKLV